MASISTTYEYPQVVHLDAAPVRRAVFTLIFFLLWFREYWDFGADVTWSPIYDRVVGSIRWMDIILGVIVLVHLWLWHRTRREWIGIPRTLKRPAVLFGFAILFAIINGARQGGRNFFYDWRGMALGIGVAFAFTYWIRKPAHLVTAVRTFALVFGLRIVEIIVEWFAGGGSRNVIPGTRTPFFDGPTISTAALLAIMGLKMCTADRSAVWRKIWVALGLMCYLFVLLCMRRTFWGELVIATAIVVLASRKYRWRLISLAAVAIVLMVSFSGKTLDERIRSLNPFEYDQFYASTNADHIFDVLDAFVHVREHPILGIGLGKAYETFTITQWKTESTMVHNAIVHVWLFYGLFGMLVYVWCHFRLFRWLRRFRFSPDARVAAFASAALAYLVGQFVMTLGFTPWPYSQTQCDIVIFFIVGSLISVRYVLPDESDSARAALEVT